MQTGHQPMRVGSREDVGAGQQHLTDERASLVLGSRVVPDPAEARLKFEIRRVGDRSFRGSHRPLESVNLQATEERVAIKAKRRLVVLLSRPNTVYEGIRR
jgi:hypothetical protein